MLCFGKAQFFLQRFLGNSSRANEKPKMNNWSNKINNWENCLKSKSYPGTDCEFLNLYY